MYRYKNTIIVLVSIFVIAFAWELFLTYGFNFFWEDFGYYHLDKELFPAEASDYCSINTILNMFSSYFQEFFKTRRLFQIGFANSSYDRPYQMLTWDTLRFLFGDKLILYRAFKAAVFSLNACLIFLIMQRVSFLLAVLGVRVRDCTSGYRAFRRHVLESIGLDSFISVGPSIVGEVLYRCRGFKIKEIPIKFIERQKGETKLNLAKLVNCLIVPWKTRIQSKR